MSNEFASQLATSLTLDELATHMENHLRSYGFGGFVYWTNLRLPPSEINGGNRFILARGPAYLKAFESRYIGKKIYKDDPILARAAESSEHFTTREIRQKTQTTHTNRRQRWIYTMEKRFGFAHDIYLPIHTPLRIQVLYAYFLGDKEDYSEKIKTLLPQLKLDAALFAANVIDFVFLGSTDQTDNLVFSVREQECLTWMAKGRSNNDIGSILNISERTVKFHVKNIMDKLDADNRTHAVAIAARCGWITN